jgi:hypothetical protein
MSRQRSWFLVMTPADANRPGSQWVRQGAVSRGKVVALPIAWQGWAALAVFVVLLAALPVLILAALFQSGSLSLVGAIVATVMIEAVLVAAFVLLVRATMTRLPP